MPTIVYEIPETYSNISRPVTHGITKDLMKKLQLPKDIAIRYPGLSDFNPQAGTTIGSEDKDVVTNFTGRVEIEAEELYLEGGLLTTAIKRFDNNYIFNDPKLGVIMKPVYTKTECKISFKYSAENRTKAVQWRDNIRGRMSQGMQALLHEIIYHYSAPYGYQQILESIHHKREAICGYGEDFLTWLENNYNERMTVLTNLDGSRGLISIPEKQIGVQGWFDFETEPELATKGKDGGEWVVDFLYTFQYDKVTQMVLSYPIVIHNQLMDDRYLNHEQIYNPYDQLRKPSHSGFLNDTFSNSNYSPEFSFVGVKIPYYDDWMPVGNVYKTIPVFTALVAIDLEDDCQVVNLLDLGETSLTQSVINYIYRNREQLPYYLADVFHLTFYKSDIAVHEDSVYIDEDLNVRSTNPLDPRDIHHVRLSVTCDLRVLCDAARTVLREDPSVCIQVIDLIDAMQRPNVSMLDKIASESIAENALNFLKLPKAPRAGLTSDSSSIKPLPGNIQRPNDIVIDRPVQQPPVDALTFKTSSEALTNGLTVIATSGMVDGKEKIIGMHNDTNYLLEVNYFLLGEILDIQELTDDDSGELANSDEYLLFDNDGNSNQYMVITQNAIIKPTLNSSKPIRLTSPTRPGIVAPMLSDNLILLGKKVISKSSLEFVISKLKHRVNLSSVGQGTGTRLVMAAGIIAHRST